MLVTIIIPAYNAGKYLKEAVDSVLNQSYRDIEIIVIDDGSTDDTEDRQRAYQADGKILYVKKENGGPASARNVGIKLAKGRYIALLDADDIWEKEKLKKQISFLEKGGFDAVCTDRFFIDDPGKKDWIRSGKRTTSRLIKENFIINSSVLIKAEILKCNLFKEDRDYFAIEDYDLWLSLAFQGYKFGYQPEALTGYRIHQEQISSARNISNLISLYRNKIAETKNRYYQLLLAYMILKMISYKIRLGFK